LRTPQGPDRVRGDVRLDARRAYAVVGLFDEDERRAAGGVRSAGQSVEVRAGGAHHGRQREVCERRLAAVLEERGEQPAAVELCAVLLGDDHDEQRLALLPRAFDEIGQRAFLLVVRGLRLGVLPEHDR
jgi:hypothetical protein